ncbi:MAG TPA: Gfo/Idh/MocA family oxidoreductase [Candidatus Binatia bacterium]|nr:Gfo/Idh/MocA family oxidoreductase [Candidatus Binatia bacterium]
MRDVAVGVIGCGYWGPNVLRSFAAVPGCRVKRAADRRPGRLRFIAERFADVELSADHAEILLDPEIDVACLVTPVPTHHTLAVAALNAGKHVFIEKPLAVRPEEAEEIIELASRKGLVVGVGHLFEYHPAITAMRAALNAGAIGDLAYLDATRINLGPPKSDVNVVWDLAPHDISILVLLAGETPGEVTAFAKSYTRVGLIDAAYLQLAFAGDRMGHIHVSWLSAHKTRRLWAMGTRGSMVYDESAPAKLQIFDQGFDSRIGARDDDAHELVYRPAKVEVPVLANDEPLRLECEDFVHAVRTGGTPRADGASGLRVVRVLAAAEESLSKRSATVSLHGSL